MDNLPTGLEGDYHVLHKLVMAYSPWENGTVESLIRTLLATIRPIILKFKSALQDGKKLRHMSA